MTATPKEAQTPVSLSWRPIVSTTGVTPGTRYGHAAGIVRYPPSRRIDLSIQTGSAGQDTADEEVEMVVLFGSDGGICHDVHAYNMRMLSAHLMLTSMF